VFEGRAEVHFAVLGRGWETQGLYRSRVATALEGLGHEVAVVPENEYVTDRDCAVWMSGSLNWFPHACRRLLEASEARPTTIVWHTEPLPLPDAAGIPLERLHARELVKVLLRDRRRTDPRSNFRTLRRMLEAGIPDVLAVSTLERRRFLAERGIESLVAPMGYDPAVGRDLGVPRDIDVLFLGTPEVPRRKRILGALRAAGVDVLELGSWRDASLWGEGRVRLLNRVKILLNIPRHRGMLSGGRMVLGMANKALVLAEPVYDPSPYRPGVHYVSAEPDAFPEVISRYLSSEDERREIVETAYTFVTTELTTRRSVATILAHVPAAPSGRARSGGHSEA
jgi:hypothetical protein